MVNRQAGVVSTGASITYGRLGRLAVDPTARDGITTASLNPRVQGPDRT